MNLRPAFWITDLSNLDWLRSRFVWLPFGMAQTPRTPAEITAAEALLILRSER